VRLAIFYLLLFLIQGFLGTLLLPLPAPDLFLLAIMSLLWRVLPWQLVLIAYGVGLLQDAVGHGNWGTHAFGLASAAMTALFLRAQLSQKGFFSRLLLVFAAFIGKWVAIIPLLMWQTGTVSIGQNVGWVMLIEGIFTLVCSILVIPWGEALMERTLLKRNPL
jgi:rod shape-determining protein MreD